MLFLPLFCKSEAILSKKLRHGYLGSNVYTSAKILISVTEILVAKSEISVSGPARLLIWTDRKFYEGKSDEARSWEPSQQCWPGWYEEALSMANHLLLLTIYLLQSSET